ncbi:hypothetical protein Bcep1808_4539 [Burkholderia vietnamiensis G4]|uniref:Uncharacterized protein n=2 Tax=Burkholderia vietnamiensis TaxID=60552 RepID=A4JMJ9_BURVG|nr:hypothetical protein Bcep1808_4539 [Burkholderia vietnamiensis G4]
MHALNADSVIAAKRCSAMQSDSYRETMSRSIKGLIWITNGASSQRVPKDSVIPDGWRKGRTLSADSRMRLSEAIRIRNLGGGT